MLFGGNMLLSGGDNRWTPYDDPVLYAKIHAWYHPSDAVLTSGVVSSLPDRGPNGYDLSQPVAANRPSISIIDGMTFIEISASGSERRLELNNTSFAAPPVTYIGVTNGPNSNNLNDFTADFSLVDSGSGRIFAVGSRFPRVFFANGNTNFNGGSANTDVLYIQYLSNHNSCTARINGVDLSKVSTTNPSNNINDLNGSDIKIVYGTEVGNLRDYAINSGEKIIFNDTLTTEERDNLENYLMIGWGVTP